ncbi:MAG: polysaccharide pyruvyl transferase family protein [Bacillota bacterium]
MKTIKALHVASFNGNVGDNANHNGFRNRLKEIINATILYTEIEMREFYQSWGLRDFNSEEFIRLCNKHDVIIIGGGNFFELKWEYSYTGTTVNISNETLEKINSPIFFNALGCDLYKGSTKKTIDNFKSFINRLTKSDKYFISVRNDGSYETIVNILGQDNAKKIHKAFDGAFHLKIKNFNYQEINNKYKAIGINIVSDMKDIRFENNNGITYKEFIKIFSELINKFFEKHKDYQMVLFPHIYSDLDAICDIMSNIRDIYRRTRIVVAPCLTGTGSEEYIFGLYKKCDFIMGMRFHSNVCAIAQNIPTIALSSYKKIDDLYSELCLSDRVVRVNKKGFEQDLIQLINYTILNKEAVTEKYRRINLKINLDSKEYYNSVLLWFRNNVLK